jgi:long-chain acyl-CoA synthetase
MSTLYEILTRHAASTPSKECICLADESSSTSYQELLERADRVAGELNRAGCRMGCRVVIGFGNSIGFFEVLFACFRAGAIAVPIDPALAPAEIDTLIEHAAPSLIVVNADTAKVFERFGTRYACWRVDGTPRVRRGASGHLPPVAPVTADSPALLLYTSGTTGEPKGVLHSHGAVLSRLDAIRAWFDFSADFVALCLLPTHFGHGLICVCLNTLAYGGTLVLAPPFNLDLITRLWNIIELHRVNTFSAVPTVIRLLLQHARRRPVQVSSTLHFVTCASAPLSPADVTAFDAAFGTPLLNCYGLTETSGWTACSARMQASSTAGGTVSVGRAINGEIRVVGPEGQAQPTGCSGEIHVRGPSLMLGYYRNPDATAAVMRDGWLATGDLGRLDADGALFVESRLEELIIRAGKNIVPNEVDRVLTSHPDVEEACTVGLPDELLGEAVAACVVARAGVEIDPQQLIDYSRSQLAAYKCPQRIVVVAEIPKTARGKTNRALLRKAFEIGAKVP